MTYETKPRWTGQGNRMCGLERMARHGPIRPMQADQRDIFEGLFARLLRRVK